MGDGTYGPCRPSRSRYIEPHPIDESMQRGPGQPQNVFSTPFHISQWSDQPPLVVPPRSVQHGQLGSIASRFGPVESQFEMSRGRNESAADAGLAWSGGQRGLAEQNRAGVATRLTAHGQPGQRGKFSLF